MPAIRVRFIKGKGLIHEQVSDSSSGGDTLDLDGTSGVSPFARNTVARTATATLGGTDVGLSTLSGSGAGGLATALKMTLPNPADVPFAMYGFRMLDARSHVITSSAPASVLAFVPPSGSFGAAGASTTQQSSHVTMSAVVGSSAIFMSDGLRYLMFAASGTHTFA